MNLNTARLIRDIKQSATYRRLSEIYYPEDHPLHGTQFGGEELCEEAFKALYPNKDMRHQVIGADVNFDEENMSRVGSFYWWE